MTQLTVGVIPAYNEETRIGEVVRRAARFVDRIIVVDDGSSDDTVGVAKSAGAFVVRHADNCGAGAATMTGIEAARRMHAQYVVTLDADGQHDPQEIPAFLEPLKQGTADIVYANRFGTKNHIPLIRRLFNALGNVVTFAATGKWVADSQCGYKALGPKAIADIDLRMAGFEFATEMVRETVAHEWRVAEIPSKVIYSEYTLAKGQSFAMGVRTAFKILLRSFLR